MAMVGDTIRIGGIVSTTFDNSNDMYETSIHGGRGDDSIMVQHPVSNGFSITSSLITGNRGNDTLHLSGAIVTTSICGGHGDNYIDFGYGFDKSGNEANTYYFGSETIADPLNFSQVHTSGADSVAVDSSWRQTCIIHLRYIRANNWLGSSEKHLYQWLHRTRVDSVNTSDDIYNRQIKRDHITGINEKRDSGTKP